MGEHLRSPIEQAAESTIAVTRNRAGKSKFPATFASRAKEGWCTRAGADFLFSRIRHHEWCLIVLLGVVLPAAARQHPEPTVEELKARIAPASVADRIHLCVEIAQKQVVETDKLYAMGEMEQGQTALQDVVTYSELARDYSIQAHRHQKQTEIAVRGMTRKLSALEHALGQPDQAPVKDALQRLERVRDDLLASMFKTKEDK